MHKMVDLWYIYSEFLCFDIERELVIWKESNPYERKYMYSSFLIKYAEIGVKGKNRYIFEDALVRQIKRSISKVQGEFEVRKTEGRIFVDALSDFDYDEAVKRIGEVFGVASFCPVIVAEDTGFDDLKKAVVDYLREEYAGEKHTFKVMCKRGRKSYPLDSMEICASVGEAVIENLDNFTVDVHNPDMYVYVEVRDKIYIYSRSIPGPGGMPLGTNGKGMLLLSGGIDSPVAGWMISKRGVEIDAVYFHAPPYTSERAKEKVVDLARLISKYTGPIRLHVINFTDIQLHIYDRCPHDELTIIMRRYMMMIAEHIAKENNCLGLITGESIGQVASQTMHALAVTNEVCTMPVFRPLIGMDKQEIVDISEKIGTYETSILPFEDCCTIFVAKHPVTKPVLSVIKKHEQALFPEINDLMKKALETDEVIVVRDDK